MFNAIQFDSWVRYKPSGFPVFCSIAEKHRWQPPSGGQASEEFFSPEVLRKSLDETEALAAALGYDLSAFRKEVGGEARLDKDIFGGGETSPLSQFQAILGVTVSYRMNYPKILRTRRIR